ncbi:MAG: hypothetical protein ACFFC7_28775, partial [Candidatus Hermodarchaeota archaeon]
TTTNRGLEPQILLNSFITSAKSRIYQNLEYYMGEKGLKRAIEALRAFVRKYGQLPTGEETEMKEIQVALADGEWDTWAIGNWEDLVRKAFKKSQ